MWKTPNSVPSLNKGQAHIWRVQLDKHQEINRLWSILSEDEKAKANKFKYPEDQKRYFVARSALRILLSRYTRVKPESITFSYNEFGKPELINCTLQFNLSHSRNYAILAFTLHNEIGVDIEYVNTSVEFKDVASIFFAKGEIKKLFQLPEIEWSQAFFNCWTRKEAFIKAVGNGLSFPLSQFEVSLHPNEPTALLATHWNPQAINHWSLHSFSPAPNFVGAVAIHGQVDHLKYLNYTSENIGSTATHNYIS